MRTAERVPPRHQSRRRRRLARALRGTAAVLLRIIAGVAAFAVVAVAGTYAIYGLVLLVRAIP